MSPALTILLSLLSRVNPADVAAIVKEIIAFADPLIAKRGFAVRTAWSVLRNLLLSPSITTDLTHLLGEVKSHPDVAAASAQWAV